jgi:ABC-2 type transport system permease protein
MRRRQNNMFAIFKREIKSYFYSPIAYILIGLFTILSSLFFILTNISYGSAQLSGLLSNMGFILLFITPILTMRTLAEDRKNGTEVLLVTSPASIGKIVLGKYFAALSVFLIMTCITLIYPLILSIFGNPSAAPIIGGYVGFILLGAAFISIGVFASSLTENQIIAAVVSFAILLVIWLVEYIGNYFGGTISKVLNYFALLARYEEFNNGILSLSPVVFFISFIGVFLFLTTRVIERRRWGQE